MTDKIQLLKITVKKISSEREFMAFALSAYMQIEKISEEHLINSLGCTQENFYKLALCKAPISTSVDFLERLEKISEYTSSSILELNKVLKRVDTISKFNSVSDNYNSFLMAARDKSESLD